MAVLTIRQFGDSILRQKAKRVRRIDASIQGLVDDMMETMRAAPGAGLAAPQVGVPLRVAVIELPEEEVITLINPEITGQEGEREVEEGCLSLPGYKGVVKRAVSVTVKARDRNGKALRIEADELLAQALEHEIDHLNGVLYVDHLVSPDSLFKVEPAEDKEPVRLQVGGGGYEPQPPRS